MIEHGRYFGAPPEPPPHWPGSGWGQPPRPAPSRRGIALLVAICVIGSLIVLSGGAALGWTISRAIVARQSAPGPLGTVPQASSATSGSLDVGRVAARVDPAVVDINVTVATLTRPTRAAGTGMILTSSGDILTNHHVVQGSTSISVVIPNHAGSYPATVVGVSPSADVALIQVHGVSGLPTVTIANSATVTVGEGVVAIGNAFGQGGTPTVSTGSVTGLSRSITASDGNGSSEQLSGLIQSDAPISPGDSGGPLVNSSGQVIGMITAGVSEGYAQTTSTTGYAVAANDAVRVVNQIRAGRAGTNVIIGQRGYLGVGLTDLDAQTAAQLGLGVSKGALVEGVVAGSAADQAGITRNSVITAVDGKPITSAADVAPALNPHKPGERISVTWVDAAGSHSATATLGTGPAA